MRRRRKSVGKLLFISNISSRISDFAASSIGAAHRLGIDFTQAANWQDTTKEQIEAEERRNVIRIYPVPISRNPFAMSNLTAYRQLVSFIEREKIDCIHCNTPVGGLLGRLAGKKCGVRRVIYQAHGFHFYKGAPLKNWMLYYPIERWLARYTDGLITINREDHALAQRKMRLRNGGRVYYVPGVGIDLGKFQETTADKAAKRRELGIPEDAVLLLSVGELNRNKNHETVIRAMAGLDVYYIVAGSGALQAHLQELVNTLGLRDRVKLLGYRSDVKELYETADIFVFPSFREGLSISLMEAMASGLPCVASRIRGNTDLLENKNGGFLCSPADASAFTDAIRRLATDGQLRQELGENNRKTVQSFSRETVIREMLKIYEAELGTAPTDVMRY